MARSLQGALTRADGAEMDPAQPSVVLVCPTLKGTALHAVSRAFGQLEISVEFVLGLELRPLGLSAIARRRREDTVFLLCGGREIDPSKLAHARAELERQGVPAHRIWAAVVDFEDPPSVAYEVQRRLTLLETTPPPPPPSAPHERPPRSSARAESRSEKLLDEAELSTAGLEVTGLHPFWRFLQTTTGRGLALAGGVIVAGVGLGVLASGWLTEPADSLAIDEPPAPSAWSVAAVPDAGEAPGELGTAAGPAKEMPPQEASDAPDAVVVMDDSSPIYDALLHRKIRALDILLVSPAATKTYKRRKVLAKLDFEAAEDHCRNLEVDDIGEWRLPTVGELGALHQASMLDSGVYWSSTKADTFGSTRVVWNTFKRRMLSMGKTWRGGRTICVRFHRPGEPSPE